MTRFLFVRHGQTDWNSQHRLQGTTDIELNEEGHSQAQKLAQRLSSEAIHAVYTSPLSRAHQTAQHISKHHPHLTINVEPALAEFAMGELEGKTIRNIRKEIGDQFWDDDTERARLGMELIAPVLSQFYDWMQELAARHPNQTVLLSSHGGKLRRFLDVFSFTPEERELLESQYLSNCSLTIVEVDGDSHRLVLYACDRHI